MQSGDALGVSRAKITILVEEAKVLEELFSLFGRRRMFDAFSPHRINEPLKLLFVHEALPTPAISFGPDR
jgi:hypothetical protein